MKIWFDSLDSMAKFLALWSGREVFDVRAALDAHPDRFIWRGIGGRTLVRVAPEWDADALAGWVGP